MINKKTRLILLLAGFATGNMMAGTLTSYVSGDVLLGFRLGGSDLVVDAGPLSTFTSASPNQRIPITQYNSSQIAQLGVDGLTWSAFTWLPNNTLAVTAPRSTIGTQTTPWLEKNSATQNGTALRMQKVIAGVTNNISFNSLNTATAIIEPDTTEGNANYPNGVSYGTAVTGGYGSDWNGTFVGNPENTTPGDFDSAGMVAQSDFYELAPGNGYTTFGTYLGYFEMATDGTMTFVAAAASGSPTVPVIQSITRSGNQTTIKYVAGVYGTYTLRSNTSLTSGVSKLNWSAVTTLTSGDTSTHSITFTDNASTEFYTITAQ